MKKIMAFIVVAATLSLGLFACGNSATQTDSLNWLAGSWYSQEWETTYTFTQNNNEWRITTSDDTVIAEDVSLESRSEDNNFVLVAKNGTKFNIEKEDDTHMKFQQEAKEGLLGLTNSVEFVKN